MVTPAFFACFWNCRCCGGLGLFNGKASPLFRLSGAICAGDRADCWAQLRATEDALNLLYREGF